MGYTYRTESAIVSVAGVSGAVDLLLANHAEQYLWNGGEGSVIRPETVMDLVRLVSENRILMVLKNRKDAVGNRPEIARISRLVG